MKKKVKPNSERRNMVPPALYLENQYARAERRAEVVRLLGLRWKPRDIAAHLGVSMSVVRSDIQYAMNAATQKMEQIAVKTRVRNMAVLDEVIRKSAQLYMETADTKQADVLIKAVDTQGRMMGLYLKDGGQSNELTINVLNAGQYTTSNYNLRVSSDESGKRGVQVIDGKADEVQDAPLLSAENDDAEAPDAPQSIRVSVNAE